MILIKHENFPDSAANLVRHFEHQERGETILKFPEEIYGKGVKPEEWFKCIGNQAVAHRPVILTMDDGIKNNSIGIRAMRECGCIFVMLGKSWSREPFQSFAWKILKAWPTAVQAAEKAHAAGKACRIDVSIRGKILVTNF